MTAVGAGRAPRIRRSPDAARALILDAAERRLIADGPSGVRVQLVANDVGISDAAVHYHFRNRDGLVDALLRRAGGQLRAELTAAMRGLDLSALDVRELSRALRHTFEERRYARLTAWLSLGGWHPNRSGMLNELVDSIHDARGRYARHVGGEPPALEDTQYALLLLSLVHWADALIGGAMRRMVGLPSDRATSTRFVDWVDDLVAARLRGATQ